MIARFITACAFALGVISPAYADDCIRDAYGSVFCGSGECLVDEYGKVHCAKQGGGAMHDQFGKVVCGPGYCAADEFGRVKCSTRSGGHALIDGSGNVVCQESCQDASAQLCEQPTQLSGLAATR